MNSKHTITRRLEFDAGHRVYQHESKCAHIHGHRYVVEIECGGMLDKLGRIIDFSVVKRLCGAWIDDNLDHGMILYHLDPLCDVWRIMGNKTYLTATQQSAIGDILYKSGQQKCYIMNTNPTAENIAAFLWSVFSKMLEPHEVSVLAVTVHETPNCVACYRP